MDNKKPMNTEEFIKRRLLLANDRVDQLKEEYGPDPQDRLSYDEGYDLGYWQGKESSYEVTLDCLELEKAQKLSSSPESKQEVLDHWLKSVDREMFRRDAFEALGKGDDYYFQTLAFLGEASMNLSLAATVLSGIEDRADFLEEIKKIQTELWDYTDSFRGYAELCKHVTEQEEKS